MKCFYYDYEWSIPIFSVLRLSNYRLLVLRFVFGTNSSSIKFHTLVIHYTIQRVDKKCFILYYESLVISSPLLYSTFGHYQIQFINRFSFFISDCVFIHIKLQPMFMRLIYKERRKITL